jgi:RNA polymerase sigma-70 factor (ECF subfamily)
LGALVPSRDQTARARPFTGRTVLESELHVAADVSSGGLVHVDQGRLRSIIDEHFEVTWRFLRRLGIPESEVDDAMQEVVLVLARKLEAVRPGSERAFLLSTAFRVASGLRRQWKRRREVGEEPLAELVGQEPSPESEATRRRERLLLDRVLRELPIDVRAVFVLYELEEMTMAEIASALGLAQGTVASRLRRGRRIFEELAARALAEPEGTR